MLGVNEPPIPPIPKLMEFPISLDTNAPNQLLVRLGAAQCTAAFFRSGQVWPTGGAPAAAPAPTPIYPLSGAFVRPVFFGNSGSLLGSPTWPSSNAGHRPS